MYRLLCRLFQTCLVVGFIFAGACLVACSGMVKPPNKATPEAAAAVGFNPKATQTKMQCQRNAKEVVKGYLKHPTTAAFAIGSTSATFAHYPDLAGILSAPRWIIKGEVESANDIGTSPHITYEVSYAIYEDEIKVMSVRLNDKIVGRHAELEELLKE